jgi:hypothetical protein
MQEIIERARQELEWPTMAEIINIVKFVFLKVYYPDGKDPLDLTFLRPDIDYTLDPKTVASLLVGIPNRHLHRNEPQSLKNLFYNFIGWQENANPTRKKINMALMPVMVILNLLALPIKALQNITKLFTEFLPYLLAVISQRYSVRLEGIWEKILEPGLTNKGVAVLALLGMTILYPIFVVSAVLWAIGRATTSPITSVKAAWHGSEGGGFFSKLWGGIKVTLSIMTTLAVYAFLFPLAMKFIAAEIIPFAATHLPVAIANAVNILTEAVAPILAAIGHVAVGPVSVGLSIIGLEAAVTTAIMSAAPALTGFGVVFAAFITTIGTGLSKLTDNFRNWWHSSGQRENVNQRSEVDSLEGTTGTGEMSGNSQSGNSQSRVTQRLEGEGEQFPQQQQDPEIPLQITLPTPASTRATTGFFSPPPGSASMGGNPSPYPDLNGSPVSSEGQNLVPGLGSPGGGQ